MTHRPPKAVAIVSGGMDSVTLAHGLAALDYDLTLVSVDYGQRHRRELLYAGKAAERLGAEHHVLDLRSLTGLLAGSALTDRTVAVPHGHYAAESMRATVVPNRNAMLLDLATSIAVATGAVMTATAVHAGDHAIYPDCRPEFVTAYEAMARLANEGFMSPVWRVHAPFLHATKADIVGVGEKHDVPWAETWSCYEGGTIHCGKCGTCVERREAFDLAGVEDPTEYAAPAVAQVPDAS